MRSAKVYYKETLAGKLTETNEGEFVFQYDEQYVESHPADFITFTMPVTNNPYFKNPIIRYWLKINLGFQCE